MNGGKPKLPTVRTIAMKDIALFISIAPFLLIPGAFSFARV
jgi:hypothetical protein